MKKLMLYILCVSFFLGYEGNVRGYSVNGACIITAGVNMYVTYSTQDSSGNFHVYVANGAYASSPTLTAHEISVGGVGSDNISTPYIYYNNDAGLVVVWEYFDSVHSIMRVAAATLPIGGTSWTTTVISNVTTENSGSFDESVSLDMDGNILVTWTAINTTTSNSVVRGVAGNINGTWHNSYTIAT